MLRKFCACCAALGILMVWPEAEQRGGYLGYDASLPQGWAVRQYLTQLNAALPLWNTAKQKLLDNKQIFSHTIDRFDPDAYCQYAPHYDYTFFEMQHSTMSWADIERMIAACPRAGMPMIRVPDEFESTLQKATDIGAIGIFEPTVDTVEKAQAVARYTRFPPQGRRSQGAGQAPTIWGVHGINYRLTVNANMLIVMMIETPIGAANAYDIARVAGVDGLLVANTDLGSLSGFAPQSPQSEALVTQIHDSALKAGKFLGTVTTAYAQPGGVRGRADHADFRLNYNGPAHDGWQPR
jgi:2-keto-3-deoxy-L-rhamnonate aldolase RhmA